jgi:hypothetical protein
MGAAWARHGRGMGAAWARHGMCELALSVALGGAFVNLVYITVCRRNHKLTEILLLTGIN